jgi:transcriptional regulator with XRE-family HTH domain
MLNAQVNHAGPSFVLPFEPMADESMGDRIRILRQARGLTQEGLGERVGVSKSAVSQWEDGSVANIKLKTFLALLEVLGTTHEYLVHGPERAQAPHARSQSRNRNSQP